MPATLGWTISLWSDIVVDVESSVFCLFRRGVWVKRSMGWQYGRGLPWSCLVEGDVCGVWIDSASF
jgi:hypothetical protein